VTDQDLRGSLRRLYYLAGLFALIGFVSYFWMRGPAPALSFALGVLGSFGNLWLFVRLTRAITPGNQPRKPWKTGIFVLRYAVLLLLGYVIVKSLGVNGLAVILGLLVSTAAVLASSTLELIQSLLQNHSSTE
jgi:peptidoglycan/LPS O-acetylase OafA/YrhL